MNSTPIQSAPPKKHRNLAQGVVAHISDNIHSGALKPGDKLPTESEIMRNVGVSRTVVREAISHLQAAALVETRHGIGTFVLEPPPPTLGLDPATVKATDSQIDAILSAVEEMERNHDDRSENAAADRNFHLAIARATGNSALVGVIEYLWAQRGTLWHKLKEHFQTEELRKQTLTDHRDILAAIASHDVAGARKAMRAHLDRVTKTFSRG